MASAVQLAGQHLEARLAAAQSIFGATAMTP
jgi:hypothetical protein